MKWFTVSIYGKREGGEHLHVIERIQAKDARSALLGMTGVHPDNITEVDADGLGARAESDGYWRASAVPV